MSRVERFDRTERLVHWSHAGLFLLLVATGALLLFSPPTRAIALGPYRVLPLAHELIGVAFLVAPFVPAMRRRGASLGRDLRSLFRWRAADLGWLVLAPLSTVLRRLRLPPQPKFNAGQRLNALFTLAAGLVLGVTGVVIWLGRAVPYWIQEPAYELHVYAAVLAVAAFLAHVVMALLHPTALVAALRGHVPRTWAERHHARWLAEDAPRST